MTQSSKATAKRHAQIIGDAGFLPHRYDEQARAFRFVNIDREIHRKSTFLTDEYLPQDLGFQAIPATDIAVADYDRAPLHFIFHSAYCCSTMLARAFDIEGVSMGLKEPVVLNDMIGWLRRSKNPKQVMPVLAQSLSLLSRPFTPGETIIVKPSNIMNPLAMTMLNILPDSKALLLYAPLENYLRSIAKKDMWGRLWVRELLVGRLQDGILRGGFTQEELLGLTDLQVAAIGWLSEHALFAEIIRRYGDTRIRVLDSESFLANQAETIRSLGILFDLGLSDNVIDNIINGPAFTTNSKTGDAFHSDDRKQEQQDSAATHAAEIDMVVKWAAEVAKADNIAIDLPARLLQ